MASANRHASSSISEADGRPSEAGEEAMDDEGKGISEMQNMAGEELVAEDEFDVESTSAPSPPGNQRMNS